MINDYKFQLNLDRINNKQTKNLRDNPSLILKGILPTLNLNLTIYNYSDLMNLPRYLFPRDDNNII